jgi:hypothetical protein
MSLRHNCMSEDLKYANRASAYGGQSSASAALTSAAAPKKRVPEWTLAIQFTIQLNTRGESIVHPRAASKNRTLPLRSPRPRRAVAKLAMA